MMKNKSKLPLGTPVSLKQINEGEITLISWNDGCANLLDQLHLKQIEQVNNRLTQLKPRKLLVNLSACQYVITSAANNWHDHTLFDLFGGSKPRAMAFVVPSNLFNHILFEAAEEQMDQHHTKVQYFRDEEKAITWLKSV